MLEETRSSDKNGSRRSAMMEKIDRGEWPTDSYEAVDSDVVEILEGERH